MEQELSVLLVEDDPIQCQELANCFESSPNIKLIAVTNNSEKALEHVVDFLPDVIILDLELHDGTGDGLTFLNRLRKLNLAFPIYVLITTHNISKTTHQQARMLGADFIMTKSSEDYNAHKVVDFISSLKNIILNTAKQKTSDDFVTPNEKWQRTKNRIISELDKIGIPPNVVGRKYLIDAISLILPSLTVVSQ